MRRFVDTIPAALLPAVNLAFVVGLEVLIGNRSEFEFGPSLLLPYFLLAAVVLVFLFCLVGLPMSDTARSRYQAVLFTLGVLGWVQSGFLVGDYGQFTGEVIDWDRYGARGWLDLLLWVAVLLAGLRYHRAVSARIRFAAPLFVVLIVAASAGRAWLAEDDAPPVTTEESAASLGLYSQESNVVHVLMDGFQTDMFLDIVEENGLAGALDGFTVFRNNAAVAAYTAMSLPAIFSGEIYNGSETPAEYHHRALRRGGFHHRLHDEGYAVHLIPKVPMYGGGYTHYAETPHLYGLSRTDRITTQVLVLWDLALFRTSPHFLRRWIHNGGDWRVRRGHGSSQLGLNTHQRMFYADYIERMQIVYDEPAYHFIHLMPPHDPFVALPDGSDAGHVLPTTRDNYKTEARLTLELFLRHLDRLRELGIYDSSLIVLHADHGYGALSMHPADTRRLRVPRAPALLAVKRVDAHGPMEYSDAPTTVADIPATILGELGLEHDRPGESVFEIPAGKRRLRIFNSYSLAAGSKGVISRMKLDGDVYDVEAWQPLGSRKIDLGRPEYTWGTRIDFGVGNDSDRYLGAGWSSGGAGGCRINLGPRARLALQVEPVVGPVELVLEFRPRLRAGEKRQLAIRLNADGTLIGEQAFAAPAPQRFEFSLPAEVVADGAIDLEFEFLALDPKPGFASGSACLISLEAAPTAR